MVGIRFQNDATERKGLGVLIGRFSFKSFDDGLTIVPPEALAALAAEGLQFTVEGPVPYERAIPSVRNPATVAVQ